MKELGGLKKNKVVHKDLIQEIEALNIAKILLSD